ncbi:hypothetical protein ACFXTI_035405 [Malus domestica]
MLILVFELLPELLWYRPNAAVYVKANRHPGKCKQPEKARELFEAMIEAGCDVNTESYTALVSAYGNSGQIETMRSERIKPSCVTLKAARSVRVEPSVLSSSIESPTFCFSTNNSSPPPNWKGKPKTY